VACAVIAQNMGDKGLFFDNLQEKTCEKQIVWKFFWPACFSQEY
jgi:hypothetical protein